MSGIKQTGNTVGFTLLELLVCIGILLILSLVAIPSWNATVSELRGIVAVNLLESALKHARSEAISRNGTVRMCASSNGSTCDTQGKWDSGWIVYLDKASKAVRTRHDPLLQRQYPLKGMVIKGNGSNRTVKFNSNGRVGFNQSFFVCNRNDSMQIARISIIHSGRIHKNGRKQPCENY